MTPLVAIVDYGVGNVGSIANMLHRIDVRSTITRAPEVLSSATHIILPGVGAFDEAVQRLRSFELIEPLEREVIGKGKQLLGICLGMQLLGEGSEEGSERGLGWIQGSCRKLDVESSGLPLPHIGWRTIRKNEDPALFSTIEETARFYFVHSYHLCCKNPVNLAATASYGSDFTASVRHNNIMGVQFHPEKSHKDGMQLLKNFASL